MIRNYRSAKTIKHIAWDMTHLTLRLSWVFEHFAKNSQKSCHIVVYICQHEKNLIWLSCPPLYTMNWFMNFNYFALFPAQLMKSLSYISVQSSSSPFVCFYRFYTNKWVSVQNYCYNLPHLKCWLDPFKVHHRTLKVFFYSLKVYLHL